MAAHLRHLDCLSDETLVRFSGGALHGEDLERAEAHIDECASCRLIVSTTAKVSLVAVNGDSKTLLSSGGSAPVTAALTPGRYHPKGILGRGGMGVVFRAYDPTLKRDVALKVVSVSGANADARKHATARLLREAEALAKLSHPHIVPVFDVGTIGDDVFVAMELVKGQTLRDWLDQRQTTDAILARFLAAGEGLAAAHAAGVVHRDFKPENVIVATGSVKVVDFGLARIGDSADALLAPATDAPPCDARTDSALMGTPRYMAPEQRDQRPTDHRADQYSFCVALFEALYGALPSSDLQVLPKRPGVSKSIQSALLRGLAVEPDDRHPDMTSLLRALRAKPIRRRTRVAAVGTALAAAALGLIATQVGANAEGPQEVPPPTSTAKEPAPQKLKAIHTFMQEHVVGKRFHQPEQTYVLEPGRIVGVDTEDEWMYDLSLEGNQLSWKRRRAVDHVNYELDEQGNRRLPGHPVERSGVDQYVFSVRAGTQMVMGLSTLESGAGWENAVSITWEDGLLTLFGKSATEFRTVRRGGTWKPAVFEFKEQYRVAEDGVTEKIVTVWGYYYNRETRTRFPEPYTTVVSVLRAEDA